MTTYSDLNDRQKFILDLAKDKKNFQTKDVFANVGEKFDVSRLTVVRDLSFLEKNNILERLGSGRSVAYKITKRYLALEKIEVEKYFSFPLSERKANPMFDDGIFSILDDAIFSQEEIEKLRIANEKYIRTKNKLSKESPTILRKEWQRLIIELSWKSSEIEGNTYTLLETEALIEEMRFAKGKDKAEAQMILNHKKALDFVLGNEDYFKDIDLLKIKKIHELLTENVDIKKDFRNHPVGITGTIYRPLPKKRDIDIAMDKLADTLSKISNPFVKAFTSLIMIAYIQPFEDGNKRTSRIIANAILHANGKAMLSYRNVDAVEYKKAMILFYEKNNINYIKEIFITQFEFAVENYFSE
jgi:Fic family protein